MGKCCAVLKTLSYAGAVALWVKGGEVTATFDEQCNFRSIGWVGREVSIQELHAFRGVRHPIELGSGPKGCSVGNGSLHGTESLLI